MQGLRRIVIAGGDLAGWTVAAALARSVRGLDCQVTVVEIPDVINVEPAQFTAPSTLDFFRHIGMDEDELLRRTGATFRLGTGIHYQNGEKDHRPLSFGQYGNSAGVVPFHHVVTRARLAGAGANIGGFSANAIAAQTGRVSRPTDEGADALPPLAYGLNLNTEKLTRLLKDNAVLNGATFVSQAIDAVELEPSSGYIEELKLADGTRLPGDLFVDCTGEAAMLIGATTEAAWVDWGHLLPCTRSLALTTDGERDSTPVHHIAAVDFGWIATTPLQQRAAHRLLYSPEFVADDEARARLEAHAVDGEPEAIATAEFRSGRRRELWANNCVAFGAAAGSVEPLDLSALHLVQSAALTLCSLLPATPASPTLAREFNRRVGGEFDSLRDFTRLHYAASAWRTSPFWKHATAVPHPDSLQQKIELFTSRGHLDLEEYSVLPAETWIAALLSAGFRPEGYHGLLDYMDTARLEQHYARLHQALLAGVVRMPEHRAYLRSLRS